MAAPVRLPASKWTGQGPRQRILASLGPRGLMLYFPLALSLALNGLWLSQWTSSNSRTSTSTSTLTSTSTDTGTYIRNISSSTSSSMSSSTSADEGNLISRSSFRGTSDRDTSDRGSREKPSREEGDSMESHRISHPQADQEAYQEAYQARSGREADRRTISDLPELTVNGESCGGPLLQRVQAQFHDVVLIISFADDVSATNASNFLRNLYGRFFKTVVLCAPSENLELGVESRGFRSWGRFPSYQYYFFPKIATRHREAAGFLWLSSDVVLNYWSLAEADKTKLWLPDLPKATGFNQAMVAFEAPLGEPPSENPLESFVQRRGAREAVQRLEPEYREQLQKSIAPSQGVYPVRVADIFYVPQKYAHKLAFDLLPAFRDFQIFQNIAVPTMFFALEHPAGFDPVLNNMVYNADGQNMQSQGWATQAAAFHPWQLLSQEQHGTLISNLSVVDDCLRKLLS